MKEFVLEAYTHNRTTILGFAAGFVLFLQQGHTWQAALLGALVATLGAVAKDAGKTGGSTPVA